MPASIRARPSWPSGCAACCRAPRSVRFATSGTEAVLMAMRLARAFTGRTKILKFEGHYHGWSDQAYISARPPLNEAGPADAPVPVAGSPGMPPSVLDDVVVAGWNDLELLTAAFERHPGEIAAVIMEPVMVNGGADRAQRRLSCGRARSLPRAGRAVHLRRGHHRFSGRAARRAAPAGRHGRSCRSTPRRSRRAFRWRWSRAVATSWTPCSTRA